MKCANTLKPPTLSAGIAKALGLASRYLGAALVLLAACTQPEKDLMSEAGGERIRTSPQAEAMMADALKDVPMEEREAVKAGILTHLRGLEKVDLAKLARSPLTAEQTEQQREMLASLKEVAQRREKLVRVTVALVPYLRSTVARAEVIRLPGDGGRPLLLLRESDATAEDLFTGLRAAALALHQHGDVPAREHNLALRPGVRRLKGRDKTRAMAVLDLLKSSAVHDVPRVGTVRAMEILTPRFKPTQ